jgi:hypothetical protein
MEQYGRLFWGKASDLESEYTAAQRLHQVVAAAIQRMLENGGPDVMPWTAVLPVLPSTLFGADAKSLPPTDGG